MNRCVPLIALACVGLLAGCRPPAPDLEAEGEELMQLSRDWSNLAGTGDLKAIMAHWAEDAVMMPPDMPPLHGKAAIRSFVEAAMQVPGFGITWEPVSVHVASSGDMAYMIERNMMTMSDTVGNPLTTYGNGITVWRKDADGSWKNVVDMWNSAPAPGN